MTERGERLTYAELADRTDALAAQIGGAARLFIIEFDNVLECVVAYLACLRAGHPVILVEPGSTERDKRTSATYGAAAIFHLADGAWRFDMLDAARPVSPHPELCVLLSTSGTTGSPKLVRLSRANIQANAESIAAYLHMRPADRAMTSLPLYYSYGMSVLNSHLHAGAALLLTQRSVAEEPFWALFESEGATTLSGVPFTFDLLERIGFRSRHYPALRYLAQAGGRMPAERVALYARWARENGKQIFVMYGQTEVSGDDKLVVAAVSGHADVPALKRALAQRFGLPMSAIAALSLDPIPTLPSGKFDYRQVLLLGQQSVDAGHATPTSLIDGYRAVLANTDVRPGDSFLDLGGDSINFVEISLLLESYLGVVPDNWEARSIASLEQPKQQKPQKAGVGAPAAPAKKAGLLVAGLVALGVLVGGELALHLRSYVLTGRSDVLDVAMGKPRLIFNRAFGVKTYRPNMTDADPTDDLQFTTNALGFRSPDIASLPASGELRIVVVGASTVAGVFAKTNNETFPSMLEDQLRRAMPGRHVNVINAGVEGLMASELDVLVERAIIPLHPTIALIYAGFNDMALICKASAPATQSLQPVPALGALPRWVMTSAVLSKYAFPLRQAPVRTGLVDPAKFFPASYGASLSRVVTRLKAAGIEPVLMTVCLSRSFRVCCPGRSSLRRISCRSCARRRRGSAMNSASKAWSWSCAA
jgi:lysophospholipase L1-like esterase/acyl carrier protein